MAVIAGILLGGCQSDLGRDGERTRTALADGSIRAALQHHFDTHRQCASVLAGSAGGRLKAKADDPIAVALRDAGLIVPTGEAESWRPAPAAARWFEASAAMPADGIRLCYARREVMRVLLDVENDTVRYTYRLTDFAPWTRSPGLRAAVPALSALATGLEILGPELLVPNKGRINPERLRDTALDPTLFEFGMDFSRGGAIADTEDARSPS